MIDYHLHLWPHGQRDIDPTIEQLSEYVEKAKEEGVVELAITEHLFRFGQAVGPLGRYFRRFPDSPMRNLMEDYWYEHSRADLDAYVEVAVAAKKAGLPVVVGLEVDYYQGEMDAVAKLLEGYPFDVLLGSVHWIDECPFDHVGDPFIEAWWDEYGVERAWDSYTRALGELANSGVVDVLAHPDLVKVTSHFPRVPEEYYDRMAEAARDSGIVAEVSSAGWRKPVGEPYPAPYLLKKFNQYGVEVTTASDAHRLGEVSMRVSELRGYLAEAGYDSLATFHDRNKTSIPIAGEG